MNKYFFIAVVLLAGCKTQIAVEEQKAEIKTNVDAKGLGIQIEASKGIQFNHPSFAFWVEDMEGKYIETLFVTKSVGTGVFGHGEEAPGKWSSIPGAVRRPAALPYWSHKRGVKAPDGLYTPAPETAVPDAISGATPTGSFKLATKMSSNPTGKFRVLLEVNQAWDSNSFWTNSKYPNDLNYFASLQPSLVYEVIVDSDILNSPLDFQLIGHGHPSGKDGELNKDLSTITTAKDIFMSITFTKK